MEEGEKTNSDYFFNRQFSKLSYLVIVIITVGYILVAWELSLDLLLNLAPVVLYGVFFLLIIKLKKLEGHWFPTRRQDYGFYIFFFCLGLWFWLLRLSIIRPSGLRVDGLYNSFFYAPLNEELYRYFCMLVIYLFLISFRSDATRIKKDRKFYGIILLSFLISDWIWISSHIQYGLFGHLELFGWSFAILATFLFLENVVVAILIHGIVNGAAALNQGLGLPFTWYWYITLYVIFVISVVLALLWRFKGKSSHEKETLVQFHKRNPKGL